MTEFQQKAIVKDASHDPTCAKKSSYFRLQNQEKPSIRFKIYPTQTSPQSPVHFFTYSPTAMRNYCRVMFTLLFAFSLFLSFLPNRAQARGFPPLTQVPSSSSNSSSSQIVKDLQADKKSPLKHVNSSFRKIPPSTSNPIQNK